MPSKTTYETKAGALRGEDAPPLSAGLDSVQGSLRGILGGAEELRSTHRQICDPTVVMKTRWIPVGVAGKGLEATPVFETYWRFAFERQEVFMRRTLAEAPAPWTADPILMKYRFTNAYRASDRVSQFLLKHVLYAGAQTPAEVFFRTMIFKIFNRIDTWQGLEASLGSIRWDSYSRRRYEEVLDSLHKAGPIYSPAYIMPAPAFGAARKHANHLSLIEHMMRAHVPQRITEARTLDEVYKILLSQPSLGPFLAFQFAIDLNYSEIINFSEMDCVVAGPGAKSGIRKCFADRGGFRDEDVIAAVAAMAEDEFRRLGLKFRSLWGRPLQLIDCQNLFCEVDKYSRVAHPETAASSARSKIKQTFKLNPSPLPQWYPPKWRLEVTQNRGCEAPRQRYRGSLSLFPMDEPRGTEDAGSRAARHN